MKKFQALILLLVLALASCGGRPNNRGEGTLNIMGSTTVAPLVEALSTQYKVTNEGRINIQAVGSTMGIIATVEGLTDIGMSSRELVADEKAVLNETIIALDAISVVVHPDNKVQALTKDQVFGIFSGKITNWQEVGGDDTPIIVISREAGSGERSSFEGLMGLTNTDNSSLVDEAKPLIAEGTGAIKANVASKKQAISYVTIGVVDQALKAVTLDGVEPTIENAKNGTYALVHNLMLLTHKDSTNAKAQDFINFALSPEGQQIVTNLNLVRVN